MAAGCRNGTQRMHRHLYTPGRSQPDPSASRPLASLARTAYGQRVLAYALHSAPQRTGRRGAGDDPRSPADGDRVRRLRELFQPRSITTILYIYRLLLYHYPYAHLLRCHYAESILKSILLTCPAI